MRGTYKTWARLPNNQFAKNTVLTLGPRIPGITWTQARVHRGPQRPSLSQRILGFGFYGRTISRNPIEQKQRYELRTKKWSTPPRDVETISKTTLIWHISYFGHNIFFLFFLIVFWRCYLHIHHKKAIKSLFKYRFKK